MSCCARPPRGEAGATGAQGAPGVADSGLVFIAEQEVTNEVPSVTFSGLDGDVDQIYLLFGRAVGGALGFGDVRLRPNGVTTNQRTIGALSGGTGVVPSVFSDTGLVVATVGFIALGDALDFAATIYAKTGYRRMVLSESMTDIGSMFVTQLGGSWDDTATNITSLVIAPDSDNFGVGSEFWLYKYRQI